MTAITAFYGRTMLKMSLAESLQGIVVTRMKTVKLLLFLLIFFMVAILCREIISQSLVNQENKKDYAEINHIKYGLFNVNKWKDQLSVIIADEISNFNLTTANERQLKKQIESQLDTLIDKVYVKIKESNKGSTKGWMKQMFINAFVDLQDIKKGIPEYADAIILQMTKPHTENEIKGGLKKQVEQYFDKTFAAQDLTKLTAILLKTGAPDIEDAKTKLEQLVLVNEKLIYRETWLLILLSVVLFMLTGLTKKALPPPLYILLVCVLLTLLLAGISTPMIDMEAKISEMSFVLLDHPVSFANQVLYFQSKSILDVFWTMITHKKPEMKIVGILLVTFSVVFPLLKMLSSISYYYNYKNARASRWIRFFVLKSGKWSMADVTVVAIFMAFVGFNGIISSQFGKLGSLSQEMVLITTNGTSLQPGFYLFLTYTLLALFLSEFLTRNVSVSPQAQKRDKEP